MITNDRICLVVKHYHPTVGSYQFDFEYRDRLTVSVYGLALNGEKTPLTRDVHYTLVQDDNHITITNPMAWSFPYIVIERVIPITQEADFKNGETMDAEVIEASLDKLTMLIQHNSSLVGHTIQFPLYEDGQSLPPAEERIGCAIGFDKQNGTTLVMYPNAQDEADRAETEANRAKAEAAKAEASANTANADALQTSQDREQTGKDKKQTGEDRVQTGLDRTQTGQDVIQTGQDVIAAKGWNDKAKKSATSASDSAIKAGTSETNALASEGKAKTSETNAKTSEGNAKTSEDNSRSSANNAKASETNAGTSARLAGESQASAAKSASSANADAVTAASKAADAKVSEANAKQYATNAQALSLKLFISDEGYICYGEKTV